MKPISHLLLSSHTFHTPPFSLPHSQALTASYFAHCTGRSNQNYLFFPTGPLARGLCALFCPKRPPPPLDQPRSAGTLAVVEHFEIASPGRVYFLTSSCSLSNLCQSDFHSQLSPRALLVKGNDSLHLATPSSPLPAFILRNFSKVFPAKCLSPGWLPSVFSPPTLHVPSIGTSTCRPLHCHLCGTP